LKKLDIERCPKLRALPPQIGQQATSLKELHLIVDCKGLERVLNIPQVTELRAQLCPNLRCVERLDNLHQLFLTKDMQGISSRWLPGLQEQHQQLHGEDMDVYTWVW